MLMSVFLIMSMNEANLGSVMSLHKIDLFYWKFVVLLLFFEECIEHGGDDDHTPQSKPNYIQYLWATQGFDLIVK